MGLFLKTLGTISQNTSSNLNFNVELSRRKDESSFAYLLEVVLDIKNINLS